MADTEFLDRYEKTLSDGLLKVCQGAGLIDSAELLDSPDISGKWDEYIKEYVTDAVDNFNEYPQSALAWAAFLGLGVANCWDTAFEAFKAAPYQSYYGARGYDDMDEHILHDLLGLDLDGDEAKKISDTFNSLALYTLGLIRHEEIEPQTALGFFALTRSYTVFFRIGATIGLKRLGYRKINLK